MAQRFVTAYVGVGDYDEYVVPLSSALIMGELPGLTPCLFVGGARSGTVKSCDIAALEGPGCIGRVTLGPRWRRRIAHAIHTALEATAAVWRTTDEDEARVTAQKQNVLLSSLGNHLTEVYGRDDRAFDYVHHISASYGWLLFPWRGRWLMLKRGSQRAPWGLRWIDVEQAHNCSSSGVY